jgi:hypothetical protein
VHYVPAELSVPASPLPFVSDLPGDWERWLAEDGTPARTPYLISPAFTYDVKLNAFFRSATMVGRRGPPSLDTQGRPEHLERPRPVTGQRSPPKGIHMELRTIPVPALPSPPAKVVVMSSPGVTVRISRTAWL